jgi:saccharopine dehydrogenase-like NADP-dependent oxidoreductase
MGIGAQFIAEGKVQATGVLAPEEAFEPAEIFSELEKRRIFVDEKTTALD